MKAINRHLYIRNGIYYYRLSLPRCLNSLQPFKEVVISLNLQEPLEARLYVARLDYEIQPKIQAFKKSIQAETSKTSLIRKAQALLKEIELIITALSI